MAKNKQAKVEQPTAANVDMPVFVPNEKGETNITVGTARLRYGTLVVEFKDSAPAVAIQRMIERGVVLGLGMVMVEPDVVNLMYQDVVEKEEAEKNTAESEETRLDETDADDKNDA